MRLPTEIFGDVIVVHTPEELAGDHACQFEKYLETVELPRVVLDMDNTETLDSGGLTALLNSSDRVHLFGGDVKIATTSPANRKILEMTRLDQEMDVFESVIEAVKSFRGA